MGKHWAKQQANQNELEDLIFMGLTWIRLNRQKAAAIAGAIVLLAAIGGFILYTAHKKTTAAWNGLFISRSLAYGGHAGEALQEIQRMETDYPGQPATTYAQLFAGDVLYQGGKYQDALSYYQKVLQAGRPEVIQPIALGDSALAEEAAGDCKDASSLAQRFLDTYPDNFLAPQVHLSLARCLGTLGDKDQAKADYQKIAIEYPGTSFAKLAQKNIQ